MLARSGDDARELREPDGEVPVVLSDSGLGSEWSGVGAADGLAGGVARPNREANGFDRRDAGLAGPLGTRAPGRGGSGGLAVRDGRGGIGSVGVWAGNLKVGY